MRDIDGGLGLRDPVEVFINFAFGQGIQGGGRFVEDDEIALFVETARDRELLLLAAGKFGTVLINIPVVIGICALRQGLDHFSKLQLAEDVVEAGFCWRITDRDILLQGQRKQLEVLKNAGNALDVGSIAEGADVFIVEENAALCGLEKAADELDDGGLAGVVETDDGDHFVLADGKADVFKDVLVASGIAERHMFKAQAFEVLIRLLALVAVDLRQIQIGINRRGIVEQDKKLHNTFRKSPERLHQLLSGTDVKREIGDADGASEHRGKGPQDGVGINDKAGNGREEELQNFGLGTQTLDVFKPGVELLIEETELFQHEVTALVKAEFLLMHRLIQNIHVVIVASVPRDRFLSPVTHFDLLFLQEDKPHKVEDKERGCHQRAEMKEHGGQRDKFNEGIQNTTHVLHHALNASHVEDGKTCAFFKVQHVRIFQFGIFQLHGFVGEKKPDQIARTLHADAAGIFCGLPQNMN